MYVHVSLRIVGPGDRGDVDLGMEDGRREGIEFIERGVYTHGTGGGGWRT